MGKGNTVAAEASGQLAYSRHVNPHWVRLLNLLEMNARYVACRGEKLRTAHGHTTLDFLRGSCARDAGPNRPDILKALHAELDRLGPSMLRGRVASLAGELADKPLAGCLEARGRYHQDINGQ